MSAAAAAETERLPFAAVWVGRPWADWWDTLPEQSCDALALYIAFAGLPDHSRSSSLSLEW